MRAELALANSWVALMEATRVEFVLECKNFSFQLKRTSNQCLKIGIVSSVMREYCEEEMWVWVFPNHKCQKSCQITSQRQVICKDFLA